MKTQYRGFDIVLHSTDAWSAEIARGGKSWSQRPSVPLDQGSDACLRRAQGLVDTFLALHGR